MGIFAGIVSVLLGCVIAFVGLFATLWDSSCEGIDCATATSRAVVINASTAQIGRARLGDSRAELDSVFGAGRRRDDTSETNREWIHLGAPGTYHNPPGCGHAYKPVAEIDYVGTKVSTCGGHSFLIVVTSRGSRTTAGAAIGDKLDEAVRHHPGLAPLQ